MNIIGTKVLFLSILIAWQNVIFAQSQGYHYTWDIELRQAYAHINQLQLSSAEQILSGYHQKNPTNLTAIYLTNYLDFYRLFIIEDYQSFRLLQPQRDRRLNALLKGPTSAPEHLFFQAEILLQWALIRLKFEEYFAAYSEVRKAYRLLERNRQKFPDFMPNLKSLGTLHALVGSIPDRYKGVFAFFSGMKGTINQGRDEVLQVLTYARQHPDFIYTEETTAMYVFLLLHLRNEREGAWLALQEYPLKQQGPLALFVRANIAMHTGRNDQAVELLAKYQPMPGQLPFYHLDFLTGLAKLNRLDEDAGFYLKRYLDHFKGRNYVKEACQKMAWHELIKGNVPGYQSWMKQCLERGYRIVDEDQYAYREAQQSKPPHAILLKARLLSDGGYYTRALAELDKHPELKKSGPEGLEYTYRLGRIWQELKDDQQALRYYQETLDLGANNAAYFACNAALLAGQIYEKNQQRDLARKMYTTCLALEPEEYRNSLHQKAKAGLNRLNG